MRLNTVPLTAVLLAVIGGAGSLFLSWSGRSPDRMPAASIALPSMTDDVPRDYSGLHNAVAYHPGFVSGSAPEGDAGFNTLSGMGVRTIISVDGAAPEVERARTRGIRYVHLPIGYNGFDEQRKLQLVRATRDALTRGPVYIHCHHGKHRSAAAAATIAASLGWQSPETGLARMRVSGTATSYSGLFACAGAAAPLAVELIDRVSADFPAVWKPSSFVKGMLEIDEVFDRLKAIEAAGWTTPANHPDMVPAAEAGRLADLLRMLEGSEYATQKPATLVSMMHDATATATALEELIVSSKQDARKLGAQFKLVAKSCTSCHAEHRD